MTKTWILKKCPVVKLLIAFCHLVINWSNAAFNHQSMSFKKNNTKQLSLFSDTEQSLILQFDQIVQQIIITAKKQLQGTNNIIQADSRHVPLPPDKLYDCVITSPPYPNRMSYIRELRPYMYWLGYLEEACEAGELNWTGKLCF